MNKKELAELLNGRDYLEEISEAECQQAKASGLVVVFGASDDLMEFRGSIYDEIGCYDGGTAYLTQSGLLKNDCGDDDCPHFSRAKSTASVIEAVWGEDGYDWTYRTTMPHETFDILEDGEPYCRGIVFDLKDLSDASMQSSPN